MGMWLRLKSPRWESSQTRLGLIDGLDSTSYIDEEEPEEEEEGEGGGVRIVLLDSIRSLR